MIEQLKSFIQERMQSDVNATLQLQGAQLAYDAVLKKIEELNCDGPAAGQCGTYQQPQEVAKPRRAGKRRGKAAVEESRVDCPDAD